MEWPDLVVAVHRDYLLAGCEVITSASYQLSLPGLRQRGLRARQAYEAIGGTVTMARRAGEGLGRE